MKQTERLNVTYTVVIDLEADEVTINRRGIKMHFSGETASTLRSQMAHAAEPAAVVDDWWHLYSDEVAA